MADTPFPGYSNHIISVFTGKVFILIQGKIKTDQIFTHYLKILSKDLDIRDEMGL